VALGLRTTPRDFCTSSAPLLAGRKTMREQIHTEAEVRQARLAYDKGNAWEGYMMSPRTGRQRAATYPTLRGRCPDTVATLYLRERAGRSGRRRETSTMQRSSTNKVTISRPQTSSKNTKTKIPTTMRPLRALTYTPTQPNSQIPIRIPTHNPAETLRRASRIFKSSTLSISNGSLSDC